MRLLSFSDVCSSEKLGMTSGKSLAFITWLPKENGLDKLDKAAGRHVHDDYDNKLDIRTPEI